MPCRNEVPLAPTPSRFPSRKASTSKPKSDTPTRVRAAQFTSSIPSPATSLDGNLPQTPCSLDQDNADQLSVNKLSEALQTLRLEDFTDIHVEAVWAHVRVYEAGKVFHTPELCRYALKQLEDNLVNAANRKGFVDFVRLTFARATYSKEEGPCKAIAATCAKRIVVLTRNCPDFLDLMRAEGRLCFLIINEIITEIPQLLLENYNVPVDVRDFAALLTGSHTDTSWRILYERSIKRLQKLDEESQKLDAARRVTYSRLVSSQEHLLATQANLASAETKSELSQARLEAKLATALNQVDILTFELSQAKADALTPNSHLSQKGNNEDVATGELVALKEAQESLFAKNTQIASLQQQLNQNKSQQARLLAELRQSAEDTELQVKDLKELHSRIYDTLQDRETELEDYKEVNEELKKENKQLIQKSVSLDTELSSLRSMALGPLLAESPVIREIPQGAQAGQAPSSPLSSPDQNILASSSPDLPTTNLNTGTHPSVPSSMASSMGSFLQKHKKGSGPMSYIDKVIQDRQVIARRLAAGVIGERQACEELQSLLTDALIEEPDAPLSTTAPAVQSHRPTGLATATSLSRSSIETSRNSALFTPNQATTHSATPIVSTLSHTVAQGPRAVDRQHSLLAQANGPVPVRPALQQVEHAQREPSRANGTPTTTASLLTLRTNGVSTATAAQQLQRSSQANGLSASTALQQAQSGPQLNRVPTLQAVQQVQRTPQTNETPAPSAVQQAQRALQPNSVLASPGSPHQIRQAIVTAQQGPSVTPVSMTSQPTATPVANARHVGPMQQNTAAPHRDHVQQDNARLQARVQFLEGQLRDARMSGVGNASGGRGARQNGKSTLHSAQSYLRISFTNLAFQVAIHQGTTTSLAVVVQLSEQPLQTAVAPHLQESPLVAVVDIPLADLLAALTVCVNHTTKS